MRSAFLDIFFMFPFGSLRYRILKWLKTYSRLSTVYDAFTNIIAIVIAALAFSPHPRLVVILAVLYAAIVFLRVRYIFKRRKEVYRTEISTIRAFFHYMNERLFNGEPGHRFTLFCVDPINRDYITPYARFEVGDVDESGIPRSNARYRKGVGYTGQAWENLQEYTSCVFPEFSARNNLVEYYIHTLRMPDDIVRDISDHMINVRHIFCYGLTGYQGQFLGVLSVDSRSSWEREEEDKSLLIELLTILGTILESSVRSPLKSRR